MGHETRYNKMPDAPAAQDGNVEGKGKGVASRGVDQETTRQADNNSVLSRLGQSMTALSRSVVHGTPAANDLASLVSSEKSGPSSSSRKVDPLLESTSTAAASGSSSTGVFRSEHTNAHVAAEQAAFSDFLDSTTVLAPAEPTGLEKAWEVATSASLTPTTFGAPSGVTESSVAEQQEMDGVEVVQLLSQTDGEMPAFEGQMTLSEPELKSLGQALFEDGSPAQMSASDWNNMLNFIPDFLRGQGDSYGILDASESSYMNLGLTDTAEAGQLWLDEWNRVLTNYNDEVWGDLGDLVQQARIEVQKFKTGQEDRTPDPAALRQLRTVLIRVRARL